MKLKLLLFVFFISILHLNAQVCFNPFQSNNVDINPVSLCYADFNGDGNLDLATANLVGTVSILLGNGNGTFVFDTTVAVGYLPRSICTADFNNDGKADLATTNTGPGNVSILLGTGAGSFVGGGGFTTSVFNTTSRISTADFNGDNKADLVVTTGFNYVLVAIGNGNGGFFTPSQVTVNNGTHAVLCNDFNGDGKTDLAVSTYSGSYNISVLLGNGIGGFGSASNFTVDDAPESITSGYFNADTIPDIATANKVNNVTGDISVLLGNGSGGFSAAVNFGVGTTTVPFAICAADFDGDGNTDLAAATIAGNSTPDISILSGDGTGNFSQPLNFAVDSFPNALVSADFNNDGNMDLAAGASKTNTDTGKVSVLINCNLTSVDQFLHGDQTVTLFPNPASGFLQIASPQNKKMEIEIYSSLGEKVMSKILLPYELLVLDKLAAGLYQVKIISDDNNYEIKKLLIAR